MQQKNESMNPDAMVASGNSTATTDAVGRTPMVSKDPISTEEVTRRPVETQTEDAPKVAAEVGDKDAYRRDFGAYAPDPQKLAASLNRSKELSDEVTRATAWLAHVTALRDVSWHQSLVMMDQLSDPFELADAKNGTVAQRYPRTKAFYGTRTEIATRAAATRRKNRANKPK